MINHHKVNQNDIKTITNKKGITQSECAKFLDVPLRTYARYENDAGRSNMINIALYLKH